jgi:hypothetical protein
MAFTFDEAISKIDTAEYSGVDGLIRLANETSASKPQEIIRRKIMAFKNEKIPEQSISEFETGYFKPTAHSANQSNQEKRP